MATMYSAANREDRDIVKCQPRSRKRCYCGCGGKATHVGRGQGCAMMGGCELYVRRWVRDGNMTKP